MDNATTIAGLLTEKGYRVTKPRLKVIAVLLKGAPLTIQQLAKRVKGVDEASIYRTMRILEKEGVVEKIQIRHALDRYALADAHHHHAVCTACGFIAHVPCSGESKKAPRVAAFAHIDDHEVTYYGLCRNCA